MWAVPWQGFCVPVDVRALAPGCHQLATGAMEVSAKTPRPRTANGHELRSDHLMARVRGDHRVLDPRVHHSIPRNIDEADEPTVLPSDDPAEAVPVQLLVPDPRGFIARLEGSAWSSFSSPLATWPRKVYVIVIGPQRSPMSTSDSLCCDSSAAATGWPARPG
jgi:hypothetical protein